VNNLSLRELPRSTRKVFIKLLKSDKPLRPEEIRKEIGLADRTISLGLRRLMSKGLIKRMPYLMDMRQPQYFIPTQIRSRFKILKS